MRETHPELSGEAAAADPAAREHDPRTRVLLEAPIVPTLLRLGAPNMLVMLVQASIGLSEVHFIGRLGTEALAGVSLAFPVVMLMQMMSSGAMGGGISSAVARALGARRVDDADAVALHTLVIALVFGILFMVTVLAGGRWMYSAMGASGAVLDAALTYSNVIFCGVVLLWIFTSLANVIRGTGNMKLPALVTCVGAALLIPLSPCLIFGLGAPLVALVGTNIGAGQYRRALRAAWIGSAISAAITETIGLCAAAFPHAWLTLFDNDPAMLDAGSQYLRAVGPFYGFFGLGMALYFASRGASSLGWPLFANFVRLVIAALGGWLVLQAGGDLTHVFMTQSAALVAFGLLIAGAIGAGAWRRAAAISAPVRALRRAT